MATQTIVGFRRDKNGTGYLDTVENENPIMFKKSDIVGWDSYMVAGKTLRLEILPKSQTSMWSGKACQKITNFTTSGGIIVVKTADNPQGVRLSEWQAPQLEGDIRNVPSSGTSTATAFAGAQDYYLCMVPGEKFTPINEYSEREKIGLVVGSVAAMIGVMALLKRR